LQVHVQRVHESLARNRSRCLSVIVKFHIAQLPSLRRRS
jgi:hypothetical protein